MSNERRNREIGPLDLVFVSRGLLKHYIAILAAWMVVIGGVYFDIGMSAGAAGIIHIAFGYLLGLGGLGIAIGLGIPIAVIAGIAFAIKGGNGGKI